MSTGEFSVYQFFMDESYEAVLRFVDAETAVEQAKKLSESVGGRIGTTQRIIITDGGDFTNFEWIFGKGVVYPKRETVPVVALVQTLDFPTDEHAKSTCKIGQGAECCRYLTMGGGGWSCEKLSPLAQVIDARTDMRAKGDNCPGLGSRS